MILLSRLQQRLTVWFCAKNVLLMCFLYNCLSVLLQSFLQMFVLHLFDSRYAGSLRICLTWQDFLCCACYKKGNKTKIEVNLLLARTQKCFSVFVHDVLPAWNCESPAGKIIMTFCLIFRLTLCRDKLSTETATVSSLFQTKQTPYLKDTTSH